MNNTKLNILTLSLDKTILTQKFGDALSRQKKYAQFFNKFFIIIFSLKEDKLPKFKKEKNVFIYSTNSHSRWFFIFDTLKIARKIIGKNKIHVITTQDPFLTGIIGFFLKKLYGMALHIEIHGEFFVNPFWRNQGLENRFFHFIGQKVLRFSDRIRVLTKRQKLFLHKNLNIKKENISIAPTFVEISFFKSKKTYRKKIKQGIFVGRFVSEKNLKGLIKVLAKVIHKNPDFKFLLVGSGELESEVKNLIKVLFLTGNIILLGDKKREEVKELIKDSDFLVLPSFSEGYGKVCVEAAACGTPVIMTNTGCAGTLIIDKKTGLVVPGDGVKALQKAIEMLVKNPGLVKKIGIAARKKVKELMDKEKSIKRIINSLIKTKEKPKLVYVIPDLDTNTASHYFHVYELLEKISSSLDIFLFAEKGKKVYLKGIKNLYIQKFHFSPLRILERIILFIYLKLKGYRNFYVHISFYSSIIASFLSKIFGGKTFFWYCGQIDFYEKENGKRNQFFRLNLKLIDFLVTANRGIRKYYFKNFNIPKQKIKILSGWVNNKRFKNLSKEKISLLKKKLGLKDKKIILFTHRLSPRKGSRYLPDIIEKTLKISKNLIFIIVGSGPDKNWLQEELEKRKLLSDVKITGSVPNKEIPYYFKISDCFIMPSREEEFGRVQLEAMAVGIPLVVFKTIGSKNLLSPKQKKLMIEQANVDKFTKTIIFALKNKEEFIKEGYSIITGYSLKKAARRFNSLFINS